MVDSAKTIERRRDKKDDESGVGELPISVASKALPQHLLDEEAPKSHWLHLWLHLVAL